MSALKILMGNKLGSCLLHTYRCRPLLHGRLVTQSHGGLARRAFPESQHRFLSYYSGVGIYLIQFSQVPCIFFGVNRGIAVGEPLETRHTGFGTKGGQSAVQQAGRRVETPESSCLI